MLLPEKLVGPEGEWEQDPCRSCKAGSRQGRQNSHVGFSSALGLTGREGREKLWDRVGSSYSWEPKRNSGRVKKTPHFGCSLCEPRALAFGHKAASNIFSSVLTTTLKSVLTTTLLQDTFFGTYAERNQSCPLPSFSKRIKVIVGGDQTRFRGRTPLNSSTPSLKLRF